ncbi:hypothetical protein PVK06_027745 [Gossypium arboreum]|uniref:Uncharacterized protein n=1 Tax=Gossypium arboreum TaxID=29729 RepID=A0ABR0P129_GOSAR|nr:hypothetical protein PVK06_027745 [Gossypium arboreum]
MTNQLIRLDDKHNSDVQLQMLEDRILEVYINNIREDVPDVIQGHLRDAGFFYVARMLGGTKLDSLLINALVERWRHTHSIFYAMSVQLHSRKSVYNSIYRTMGMLLWCQLLVSIGVQHASNY